MNKQNVALVANALEQNANLFDMREGFRQNNKEDGTIMSYNQAEKPAFVVINNEKILVGDCGTSMCMAGLTTLLLSPNLDLLYDWDDVKNEAQEILGMTYDEATLLFETPLIKESSLGYDLQGFLDDGGTREEYAKIGANRLREAAGLLLK